MYLLILESIGTSELILIAVVALIIFGPRKLPQMVKTIGRTMGEFRSATNEFKSTWEREASLAEEQDGQERMLSQNADLPKEDNVPRNTIENQETTALKPQIKELSAEEIAGAFPNNQIQKKADFEKETQAETAEDDKRNWL